ncbi:MAG: hypothetical protein ACLTKG_02375 [Collinsella intestinalis]
MFGEVSLVSPLANLLVGPAMSGLLVTGLLGTGVATISDVLAQVAGVSSAAGAIAEFALAPADGLARISVFFAQVCAGVPFALVSVESSWVVAPIIRCGTPGVCSLEARHAEASRSRARPRIRLYCRACFLLDPLCSSRGHCARYRAGRCDLDTRRAVDAAC